MTAWWWKQRGSRQGFAKLSEREMCSRGREAPRLRVRLPSLPPPLYRPPGGRRPWRWDLPRGRRPRGWSAPQGKWRPPHPRVSNPRRRGGPRGVHQPTMGWFPSPLQPMGPSGMGGPTWWTAGTLLVVRYNTGDPKSFPMAETTLPIYNSSPPDHSGTPRDIQDLIRDSEQLSDYCILISLQP